MPTIYENIENLIDENTSRQMLDKIAVIKAQVDEMQEKSAKQEADYKDLLKDYTAVIKTSVFNVDNPRKIDEGQPKEVTFESFLDDWTAKNEKLK